MRRGAGIAGNPVLIGAATMLVVLVAVFLAYNANKGLPFVPTYELKAEVPERGEPGRRQRRAHRRLARRLRRRDHAADAATTASTVAVLTLTLEKSVAPLPRDSTLIIRPRSALGLKYVEITRGTRRARATPTARRSRSAPPRRRPSSSTRSSACSTTRRARRSPSNTTGFGDALAGRGESINTAIGAFKPLLRDIIPVAQNLAVAARPTCAASSARSAARRRSSRPRPRSRPSCSSTSTSRSARCARSRGRSSRSRSSTACPRSTPASATSRSSGRSCATASCCSATCVRRRRAAHVRADDRRRARGGRQGAAAHAAAQPPARVAARGAAALLRGPDGPARPEARRRTALNALNPTLAYLTPAQTQCNYITLFFRNIASHLSEGDRNGTWQRFIIVPTPQGPNNEGGPSVRPGQRADRGQPPPRQPVPEHGVAGPAEGVRGRQRALRRRADRDRATRPGKQSATTEKTTR